MMVGNFDLIVLLMRNGADITSLNDFDQTPTFFADKSISEKLFVPTISYARSENKGKNIMFIFLEIDEKMLKMMKNEMRINNLQRKRQQEAKERTERMMLGLRLSTGSFKSKSTNEISSNKLAGS